MDQAVAFADALAAKTTPSLWPTLIRLRVMRLALNPASRTAEANLQQSAGEAVRELFDQADGRGSDESREIAGRVYKGDSLRSAPRRRAGLASRSYMVINELSECGYCAE
jgi:hypothetical protein